MSNIIMKHTLTNALVMSCLLLAATSSSAEALNLQSSDKADIAIKNVAAHPNTTVLDETSAVSYENGICQFDLFYSFENKGKIKTAPFTYTLKNNGTLINQHLNIVIEPNAYETFYMVAHFKPGINTLRLDADTGNQVNESNENNNYLVKQYRVTGSCGGNQNHQTTLSNAAQKKPNPNKVTPAKAKSVKQMKQMKQMPIEQRPN